MKSGSPAKSDNPANSSYSGKSGNPGKDCTIKLKQQLNIDQRGVSGLSARTVPKEVMVMDCYIEYISRLFLCM